MFAFLGVTELEVIVSEGLRVSDALRDAAMGAAMTRVAEI